MGFRVNTNVSALQAQSSMTKVARAKEDSTVKLSSGLRINKAADDAAGLAISEKLKAEIRSSKQAGRNANDGISLVQTAEGGLSETSTILTRMRELSIQAASDTLGDSERQKAGYEYDNLRDELDRIAQSTQFNGKKLLNGTGEKLDFQVGVGNHSLDDQITYNTRSVTSDSKALGVDSISISTKSSAQMGLAHIDSAINKISGHRSLLGSIQNRLVNSSNNLMIYNENMSAANNRIRDVDYAEESANHAKNSILENAGTAVTAQANMSGANAMKLLD